MTAPVSKVVVLGRDAPLWLAAAVVARALKPAGVAVEAIELPSALTASDVYPSLPPLEALHNQLRIEEDALLRATRGSFTLGQNFADGEGATPPFLHAYGSAGAAIDGADFFAYWLKARRFGLGVGLEDFSLTASAARHGRLMIPDDETEIYGRCDYAYHLPAIAYAALLKAVALGNGVTAHRAATVEITRDGHTIHSVNGVEGQLFLDTAAEAPLAGGERQSWRTHFPADRILAASAPRLASIPVYAEIRAGERGWTGIYPSRDRTHITHVYSSATGDEQALQDAVTTSGLPLTDAVIRPSDPGIRATAWDGNIVAIGEAACAFDPLHAVALHAVQLGLINLLACFPASENFAAQRAEYNRVIASAFARVRDFQSAHYALNRYGDTGFWNAGRTTSPDLAHRIALFEARGEIAPWEDESFAPDSWRMLFTGHGLIPETWLPLVDRTSLDAMKAQFRRMLGFVKEQVLRQPAHHAWLERLDA
jgi:tryptophan halogenase